MLQLEPREVVSNTTIPNEKRFIRTDCILVLANLRIEISIRMAPSVYSLVRSKGMPKYLLYGNTLRWAILTPFQLYQPP